MFEVVPGGPERSRYVRERQEERAERFQVWSPCRSLGPILSGTLWETIVTAREAEAFIHHLLLLMSAGLVLEE